MSEDLSYLADYEFITPPRMVDGELELRLLATVPYNPEKGWVPSYAFLMLHSETGAVMGDLDLRVALSDKLRLLGGHIGYEVNEPYRGRRYATRACRLMLPFIKELGINPVLITCDPANIPSVKTIEALGAELVRTHRVELGPGQWRWTNVYELWLA
ncbi:MAG: GNAT family N-acetyltransferase [Candidatus Promineifilaceae bacterium]